jgi:tripartite-type tricarboxylate transporter receptor subunit TctC
MLCTNHSKRSPDFPNVPTLTEAGYPNSDVPLWFCIWSPAGVPQPILDALHAKVTEISKTPDIAATLILSGNVPASSTQAELLAFREAETKTMADLIKTANIKLE